MMVLEETRKTYYVLASTDDKWEMLFLKGYSDPQAVMMSDEPTTFSSLRAVNEFLNTESGKEFLCKYPLMKAYPVYVTKSTCLDWEKGLTADQITTTYNGFNNSPTSEKGI